MLQGGGDDQLGQTVSTDQVGENRTDGQNWQQRGH